MQLGGTITDKKKTGRTIFWTAARKNQLKRLANNHKWKLHASRKNIKNKHFLLKSEKTPKYRNRRRKQRIWAKNWQTYYIDRHVAWFWTIKNILHMMVQTRKETTTTTRITNLNVQIVFVFLKKRNIRTKYSVSVAISNRGISKT